MPTLQGMSIVDFIHYQPNPNTVAISFASQIDRQFDPNLYDQLSSKYCQYDDVLVIKAEDIPKPIEDCQVFTKADAKHVKDFVNQYHDRNIVIHCNAGVSRTGSLIHYVQQTYPNFKLIGQQKFSFNPLISYLLDVDQDNLKRLFNENKDVMDALKNI